MKRRDFVLLSAVGVAVVAIPSTYYYFGDVEYDISLASPKSLSLIWDNETIKTMGAAYLRQASDEASVRSLVGHLQTVTSDGLEAAIKNDFASGKHVLIDGWILSITEARQCALASIVKPKD